MIIFFDRDSPNGFSGPQDGESDHTGIVEKVENGCVYTIEGNSGDSCRQKSYPVGYYEILGYGISAYQTQISASGSLRSLVPRFFALVG